MEHVAHLNEADFRCLERFSRAGHRYVRALADDEALKTAVSVVVDLAIPSALTLIGIVNPAARLILVVRAECVHMLTPVLWTPPPGGGRHVQCVWRDSSGSWVERVDARLALSLRGSALASLQSAVVASLGRLKSASGQVVMRAVSLPDEAFLLARRPRVRCDRELRRVGLTSVARIHRLARFASAIDRILAGRGPLVRVALEVGFSSARTLEYQSRRVFGRTLSDVRNRAAGESAAIGHAISRLILR